MKYEATAGQIKYKAAYNGKHPQLQHSYGTAVFDEKDFRWKFKPEGAHTEWYRVFFNSLEFTKPDATLDV